MKALNDSELVQAVYKGVEIGKNSFSPSIDFEFLIHKEVPFNLTIGYGKRRIYDSDAKAPDDVKGYKVKYDRKEVNKQMEDAGLLIHFK